MLSLTGKVSRIWSRRVKPPETSITINCVSANSGSCFPKEIKKLLEEDEKLVCANGMLRHFGRKGEKSIADLTLLGLLLIASIGERAFWVEFARPTFCLYMTSALLLPFRNETILKTYSFHKHGRLLFVYKAAKMWDAGKACSMQNAMTPTFDFAFSTELYKF